mmetsp:Transcript_18932/g.28041  ORF Transcript_18932/g.28041 Transcript_18932/m.28041 type:complete len:794 (+) Transcript_18932:115-2496(+)|eukprot:CAMPEP_0194211984 /NCGR_PEP_ID=MMETSP0156-20130528/11450_1 /TAXON_ID=33649 /ORGANISM="Thalassionema nitzschioides, Strain L26-B" /LENGTH=793 /DNA_ID=CAMNT_0038939679 /DNA_START=51 /DNA_END=2432 /DNA_ORIENTATION=+
MGDSDDEEANLKDAVGDAVVDRANFQYYEECREKGCCYRFWEEFVVHPYTVMEVGGRVVDVQKTFDFKPVWVAWIFKGVCFGLAVTTMVFDLLWYTGDYNFYMAYLEHWFLAMAILYLFLSLMITISCGFPRQPLLGVERTNWNVCFTWGFYPVVFVMGLVNLLQYWFLTSDEDGFIRDIDYFAIIKNAAMPLLLFIEGQLINRIPIRWSHLPWSQLALVAYMGWSMIHFLTDIGNPDLDPARQVDVVNAKSNGITDIQVAFADDNRDYHDLPIYSWLDWSRENRGETALYCGVILAGVVPVAFILLYLFSWPCRRYCPLKDGPSPEPPEPRDMPDEVELVIYPGPMGIKFSGKSPPMITYINDDSPYAEETDANPVMIVEGMAVDTFTIGGETHYELSSKQLVKLIKGSTDGDEDRVMRCINLETRELTPKPEEGEDMVEAVILNLPPGSLGLVLNGTPPAIEMISDESPIVDDVYVGMVADYLELPEFGITYYEMTTPEFTSYLKENADSEDRVVRFIDPSRQELTKDPAGLPPVTAFEIECDPGSIGLVFSKTTPPKVTRMKDDSPMQGTDVQVGLLVDTLTLEDGTIHYEMSGAEFTSLLKQHRDEPGRKIRFIAEGEELTEPPADEEREMVDELEVELPEGRLGVSFQNTPPEVVAMSDESPLHAEGVMVGHVVDWLEIGGSSGDKLHGLTSEDLINNLMTFGEAGVERRLRFINPATTDLTDPPEGERDIEANGAEEGEEGGEDAFGGEEDPYGAEEGGIDYGAEDPYGGGEFEAFPEEDPEEGKEE